MHASCWAVVIYSQWATHVSILVIASNNQIYSQWLYIVLEHSRSPVIHKMITHGIDDLSQRHTGTVLLDYLLV